MTTAPKSPAAATLFNAFEDDHRHLTAGLYEVLNRLRDGDLEGGLNLADELDRIAGPHIEFEEEVFYPSLRERLGPAFVDDLYDEHHAGKRALQLLRAFEPAAAGEQEKVELVEKVVQWLEVALDHALSCGTLLSHLEALEDRELAEMHQTLLEFRKRGRRWTDRPDPARSETPAATTVPA